MRSPLQPGSFHVGSRAWSLYVNHVAASPLVSREARLRIYRRFGLDVDAATIHPRCYFHTADISIGAGCILNYGVHIENMARVVVGPNTGLGIFTTVITSTHALGPHEYRAGAWSSEQVVIGSGCWVGARSTLLAGVVVGDGCLIAAGALVRDDCEPDGLYAGVPARRIRDLEPEPTAVSEN